MNPILMMAQGHIAQSAAQVAGPYKPFVALVPRKGILMTWIETDKFADFPSGSIVKVSLGRFYEGITHDIKDEHLIQGPVCDFERKLDPMDPKTGFTIIMEEM